MGADQFEAVLVCAVNLDLVFVGKRRKMECAKDCGRHQQNEPMDAKQFESELRSLIRAEPFQPFVIRISEGDNLIVDQPAVTLGGGRATVIDCRGEIHFLSSEGVREFATIGEGARHTRSAESATNHSQRERQSMTPEQFEAKMRTFLRRNPFEPFLVRMDTDQLIVIANPKAVALAAGGAGYIAPEKIHFIESANVVDIRPVQELSTP